MKHYAITGGIGSGKSTVLALFKKLGIPTFSADDSAKYAMENNFKVKQKVIELFGDAAYTNGVLNRKLLAGQVFYDKAKLDALNAVVHPAAKAAYEQWRDTQNAPYTMYEIPILFELHAQDRFDGVLLVVTSNEERIKRVKIRDNVTEDTVRARMKNQWTDKQKLELSDFVIENTDLSKTEDQIKALHLQLLEESK